MCGITGVWQFNGRAIDLASLQGATKALRHRGPDDEGYLLVNTRNLNLLLGGGADTTASLKLPTLASLRDTDADLAFGFRRLSILDLSTAGHQPMGSADGHYWIIFNGEIYNYLELRAELARSGFEFQTGTDTEVILAAYQHWGVDCLSRLNGMWAFALWDARKRQLFLARDPFGIKPLYYIKDEQRLLFASEIKALLEYSDVSRRANPDRLYEYLRLGLTDYGEETMFEQVRQIPAAHCMVVSLDNPQAAQAKRYWQIDFEQRLNISFEDAASRLHELFLESVKLHLRSDVRVGAALSGGIDSSAIVASMRAVEPQVELHTFSYTADDPALSEERWVDIAAEAAGAKVYKVRPVASELVADLDRLIETQDEPFGSTSIYAQNRVFRLAHENGMKVMLEGQGADEMLAGYGMYLVARFGSLLRQGRLSEAWHFFEQASTLPGTVGLKLLLSAVGFLLPLRLQLLAIRARGNNRVPAWLNGSWFAKQGAAPRYRLKGRSRNPLQELLYETIIEGSLPQLLRYGDRNSMAHSIESRVPFLTANLAEFILALPEEHIISPDGTSKSVFRRAMRGVVPDAILDRRDKVAFATPIRDWLSVLRPWVEEVLQSKTARQIPALNLPVMRQEWDDILSGRRQFDFRVWRWLNLIRWAERLEVSF